MAQLAELPPPQGEVGAFLDAVAGRRPLPGLPEGLPEEVGEILGKLREAVEDQGV